MAPELLEEGAACLLILTSHLLALLAGCPIADFVFAHIPFIRRCLESLPEFEDDVEPDKIEWERARRKTESKKVLNARRKML